MLTVAYVHAFNFDDRYLWAGRPFTEDLNVWNFLQVLIANGVFRFGIPLFFLRAGFLMAETETKYTALSRLKKRSLTLLVPYVAWALVGTGITWLFESSDVLSGYAQSSWLRPFDNKPVHDWTWQQGLEGIFLQPISFQLWFLRSLFIFSILYPLLTLALAKRGWILISILTVLWLLSIGIFFFVEAEGLLSFSLGIWMSKGGFDPDKVKRFVLKYHILWLLPVFLLVKTWIGFAHQDLIAPGYFMYKLSQPLLVFAVWFGYDATLGKIEHTPLEGWSRYNFFIYGFHVPVVYYLTDWIFDVYGKEDPFRFLVFLLLPLAIAAFCLVMGKLIERFAYPVFWVLTGGRK
jgi:fucose 4-O-acetylase-like acetyltransferase